MTRSNRKGGPRRTTHDDEIDVCVLSTRRGREWRVSGVPDIAYSSREKRHVSMGVSNVTLCSTYLVQASRRRARQCLRGARRGDETLDGGREWETRTRQRRLGTGGAQQDAPIQERVILAPDSFPITHCKYT